MKYCDYKKTLFEKKNKQDEKRKKYNVNLTDR